MNCPPAVVEVDNQPPLLELDDRLAWGDGISLQVKISRGMAHH
jgi:hypothetical protein